MISWIQDIRKRIADRKKEWDKKNTRYILCVANKDRMPVRLVSKNFDHFRTQTKKFKDTDIFYIAQRRGWRMKHIKALAVYSRKLDELVRTKESAFWELFRMRI